MKNEKKWSLQLGGRELCISTGVYAGQANGAVTAQYGDTVVLATAVMSKSAGQSRGYFPLMVDYEERYYAAGKIKGSRFIKREGRPSEDAVLSGRAVDRTVRPLFDARMRNEVQVIATTLSFDGENDPDLVAMIAASAALAISDIPWNGPIGAVRVGKSPAGFVLNPSTEEREHAENDLDLLLSGTKDKINMIEAAPLTINYVARLVRATRPSDASAPKFVKDLVGWGAGPRAGQFLIAGAKAIAAMDGRPAINVNDVRQVAIPVLRHRVSTNFQAQAEGVNSETVIKRLIAELPEPKIAKYE